jgi:cellobiose phosphorylase
LGHSCWASAFQPLDVEVDRAALHRLIRTRFGPNQARPTIVTSTAGEVKHWAAMSCFTDGRRAAYIAMRTAPTREFRFAVVGSMTDPAEAARLARKYEGDVSIPAMLREAAGFWSGISREVRFQGGGEETASLNTIFPWMVHNALIHLSAPHGLEQYEGSAWGTRESPGWSIPAGART